MIQSKLDDFFASSPVVGYEAAIDTRQYLFISRNSESVLGYVASDFLREDTFWGQYIHPDDRQELAEIFAGLTVGDVHRLKYRFRRQGDDYAWIQDDLQVIQRQGQAVILGTLIDISEQENLRQTLIEKEKELRQNQDLTQRILDAIAYPIFIKDEQHRYAFANQSLSEFMGLSREFMLGKTDYEFFPVGQADIFREQDQQVRQNNQVEHIDEIVINPQGQKRSIWTTKCCFETDQKYLLGIVRDVTSLKETEQSLSQSLHRFQKIADSVPGMIYQFYRLANGGFGASFVNTCCQEIYEVSPEQAIADVNLLIAMTHPEDLAQLLQSIEESAQSLSKWDGEWRIITPSGKLKWLHGTSEPEQHENGDIVWDGIILDVSAKQAALQERKEAEASLQQSLHRFEKVANNVREMLFQMVRTTDGRFSLSYVNDHCEKIFGYAKEKAIADIQPILAMTHPDDLAGLIDSLEASYQNQTRWQYEWRITTPSGTEKWLKGESEPELLANGEMIWDGFILDISDRKFIEKQLIYSRELKSVAIEIFQDLLRNKDPKFHDILQKIGEVTASNRVFLICHSDPKRGSIVAQEWLDDSCTNKIGHYFHNLEFDPDSWWMTQITQDRDIICNYCENCRDCDGLPLEAKSLRIRLRDAGISSLVAVPITDSQKQLWGVICLGLTQSDKRAFIQEDAQVLRIVGEMLYMASARQNQRQQLLEKETKFRGIFDNVGVGIVQLDGEFCFTEVNFAFAHMLGEAPEKFIGQPFAKLTSLDNQSLGDRLIHQLSTELQISGFTQQEQCLTNSFGQKIWVKINISQVFSETYPVYYVAVIEDITQHKRSTEINKALLVRNESLLLALGEVIYDHCLVNDVLKWEGNCEEILGYSAAELGNNTKSWLARIHPADVDAVITEFNRAMTEENKIFDIEYRFCCADNSYRWMHDRGVIQADLQGQSERFIGVMRDIGDRKESEQRLRESEQRYRQIVETAQEGIWVLDEAALTTYVNPQMAEMLGYRPEEMIAKSLFSFMNSTKTEEAQQDFSRRQAGKFANSDFCFKHRDGSEVWTMISTNPLRNETGDFIGALGMITDVSDRRRAEQEVIRNRDLREAIFNESADAIFLVDSVTLLTFDCNQKAVEMFEVSDKAELINIEGNILQRYQFSKLEIEAIAADIEATGSWNREIEYVTKKGRVFWGHIVAKNVTVAGRNMNLVRVTDIDQRKRAEQQLLQTNAELERATRLKDEFLANMSHELRTPLNAILGLSEVLQDQIYGEINTKQQRSLQTIERNGQHLLELINDVLNLSKIEAGHLVLNPHPVSIRQICNDSLSLIRGQINEKKQKLNIHYPKIAAIIEGDELRLRQAIINLLSNAIKFTDLGGEIEFSITLEPEQNQLSIHVADNGIGIDKANLDLLFQPFVQLDSSLNRRFSGTGLGLALVRRIAELHQGSVSVQSELGKGSKFSIHLPWNPLSSEEKKSPTMTSSLRTEILNLSHPNCTKTQPLILIADDDEDNIEMMWDYLLSRGYRLIRATNGQEAIDLVHQHQPNLVLMDIQMPEMDGLMAIAILRETFKKENLRIIALTALAMEGDRQRCLDSGADFYLTKPYRLKTLDQHIQDLIY